MIDVSESSSRPLGEHAHDTVTENDLHTSLLSCIYLQLYIVAMIFCLCLTRDLLQYTENPLLNLKRERTKHTRVTVPSFVFWTGAMTV